MKIHGDQLKDLRKAHGLTMAEVAEKLGVTEGTISRYENGQIKRVSPSVITGYSRLFNVPATELYENPETEWLAAFSGAGKHDPRVRGFIEYLEEQAEKEEVSNFSSRDASHPQGYHRSQPHLSLCFYG